MHSILKRAVALTTAALFSCFQLSPAFADPPPAPEPAPKADVKVDTTPPPVPTKDGKTEKKAGEGKNLTGNININVEPPPPTPLVPKPRLQIKIKKGPNETWTESQEELGKKAMRGQQNMLKGLSNSSSESGEDDDDDDDSDDASSSNPCSGSFDSSADTQKGVYDTRCESEGVIKLKLKAAKDAGDRHTSGRRQPPTHKDRSWVPWAIGGTALVLATGMLTYGLTKGGPLVSATGGSNYGAPEPAAAMFSF